MKKSELERRVEALETALEEARDLIDQALGLEDEEDSSLSSEEEPDEEEG